jgi:lipid II:glycine glycyltransferase (peptidoglycan interpeptide bridge formation enzyme)
MVDASELPAAIQGADAGVVPTRSNVFTDGLLPTKLMEYVAMGTPVIAARTPTVVSYFDDDMVQFFEPGDAADLAAAIRALASDAGRRDALVENADAFHRKYDWESVAAGYAGLVDAIIGGQAVPTAARGPAPVRRATRLSHPVAMQRSRSGNSMRTSSDAHDPEWDDFLAGLPGGHHTQTALWSQVKASLGWRVVRVVADRNSRITGGAQILYRRIPIVGAVGYVSRGPVVAADDSELSARILDAVERIAGELHIRHLTVQPSGVGESTPSYLVGRGYLASSTEVAPRATVVVDVTPEADQILAAMTSRTRYNVRLSERKSVIVREGDSDDLDTFHRLLQATAQRQGFTVQPKSYFETMWHVLAPHGHVRLALAEHDGEAISAQIAIAFGDTVVNKLSVWSGRAGNRRPNEALQWSTILWAHQRGYRCYDLEGLKLKAAQAVVRGEPLPTTATQSVTSFKIGFGGTVVVMPSAHVCIPNRAVRWAFSEAYPRVSGLGSVKAIVKGMRTGSARSGD